jgi:hypothetical protein
MGISYFAYNVSGDSTADADMIRMAVDPVSMSNWKPYGEMFRGGDGQPFFAGAPTLTLNFNSMPYDKNPDGSTISGAVAGSKKFYEDWERARDDKGQRYTVNIIDPLTNTWSKHTCVIPWVDWSGRESGAAFSSFEITITAIGVAFDTAPAWGEVSPPAYAEDAATQGDDLVGAIGYGIIGQGLIGQGAMFGPNTIGYGVIGRGLIGEGSVT